MNEKLNKDKIPPSVKRDSPAINLPGAKNPKHQEWVNKDDKNKNSQDASKESKEHVSREKKDEDTINNDSAFRGYKSTNQPNEYSTADI